MSGTASIAPSLIGGRYRVERRLGAGGFGQVFEVTDLQAGGRWALKLMTNLDERRRDSFRHEAFASNIVARASSHVVRVQDAQVDSVHGAFIVMELLEGDTLAECVRALRARGALLSTSATLAVLRQVAHALDAAHANHLVHCDIKPENVFLARVKDAAASVKVYVLDFGIAKLRSDLRATHSASTAIGTPQWMPPERYDGVALPQSDVFSFALLATYMIVGAPMPRTERQRARAWAKREGVMLPESFDRWLERATRDAPSERFSTVNEALTQLEGALNAAAAYAPTIAIAAAPPTVLATPKPPVAAKTEVMRSSDVSSAPAPRKSRRWLALAAASVASLALSAWLVSLLGNSTATLLPPTNTVRVAPTLVVNALPPNDARCAGAAADELGLLLRWRDTVSARTIASASFAALYTHPAMVRSVSENLLPPSEIAAIRERLNRAGRQISFDLSACRATSEDLAPLSGRAYANARSSCGSNVVTTVRMRAETEGYACTHDDPGRHAAGEYIIRIRRDTDMPPRICYEAWSNAVDDAVCRR